jgi:hypothetical protein
MSFIASAMSFLRTALYSLRFGELEIFGVGIAHSYAVIVCIRRQYSAICANNQQG